MHKSNLLPLSVEHSLPLLLLYKAGSLTLNFLSPPTPLILVSNFTWNQSWRYSLYRTTTSSANSILYKLTFLANFLHHILTSFSPSTFFNDTQVGISQKWSPLTRTSQNRSHLLQHTTSSALQAPLPPTMHIGTSNALKIG